MPPRPFVVPDNTVPISMALLNREDHLRVFVRGCGRWCASSEWQWRASRDALSLHHADELVRATGGRVIDPESCLGTEEPLAYVEVMGKIDRKQAYEALRALKDNDWGCRG